jgi:ABC-type dipeptide/oligopeptide/nickel transport system permease component
MDALPRTILLAIAAMFIATLGIPLGVMAAVKKDTWLDPPLSFSAHGYFGSFFLWES